MRFLDEHRRRPALLADHLPWAAMVAPGIILNKDGSFTSGIRFRGPDLESASDGELMSVRARLAQCDAAGLPAALETATESNLAIYTAMGFRITDTFKLDDGPQFWGMWRDPA